MRLARNGEITPAMEFVAERESLSPSSSATKSPAADSSSPPTSTTSPARSSPWASAKSPHVKINANIGNSAVSSYIDEEVEKLRSP